MRVAAIVQEALDCKSFYLLPEDGRPLNRFEPGQYLTFELPTESDEGSLVRCYSLSERPREDYYRVTVKQIHASNDNQSDLEGQGSGYFHRQVQVGSTLQVRAPQGAFFLDPRDELPVVLIGAGIGITPMMSMLSAIAHDRSRRDVYLFAGFRNSREHPFSEPLQDICTRHENLRLDICYSNPMPGDLCGRDFDHRGHVDLSRIQTKLPSSNFRFYLCGPPAMMESLVPALLEWGVPDDHIYFEAFGPATVRRLRKPRSREPREVRFLRAEKQLTWTGTENSLLELAESNGVSLPAGCRAGNCGQCLTEVRSGSFAHVKPPGVALSQSQCLACIALPEEDLELEA